MRLFLAVTLPEGVQEGIARAAAASRAAAPGVRWVKAEQLHLTIRFLGERADGEEARVATAVGAALSGLPSFDAALRGAGAFPNFRRPRVVWLGMHPLDRFAEIARAVDGALLPLGIEGESRPFRAHVNLGRVGDGMAPAQAQALARTLRDIRATWPVAVRDVALIHSTLARSGPTYRELVRLPLAAPGVS